MSVLFGSYQKNKTSVNLSIVVELFFNDKIYCFNILLKSTCKHSSGILLSQYVFEDDNVSVDQFTTDSLWTENRCIIKFVKQLFVKSHIAI